MSYRNFLHWVFLGALVGLSAGSAIAQEGESVYGDRLPPEAIGAGYIEGMDAVLAREREAARHPAKDHVKAGAWVVPSPRAITAPHSGKRNIVNKTGDLRMAFTLPAGSTLDGFWIAGQTSDVASTNGVQAIGYRDGEIVAQTDWFCDIRHEPVWFKTDLHDVDRVEIVALPVLAGAGWYGIDDLTYTTTDANGKTRRIVLDFEDLNYNTDLTGTNYGGIQWERGYGEYLADQAVSPPQIPPGFEGQSTPMPAIATEGGGMRTAPALLQTVQGLVRGDAGQFSYPPDTCGAVGVNHAMIIVNTTVGVYLRSNGQRVMLATLSSFQPGSNGDARIQYDQFSGRWIVISSDFSSTIYLAISLTSDPTGAWYKTSFTAALGADSGKWPDYPTLGYDHNGIYVASYMVGGANGMTIWAVDKAPLLAPSPSLGAITAFRNLPWEGAIQPCMTFGTPPGEYLVSRNGYNAIRIRRVDPPMSNPTLTQVANVNVLAFSDPPTAPAQGASTNMDTVDSRLMMAVYRGNYIYTAHTVNVNGRAACNWYQLQASPATLTQSGTVSDPSLYYYFPSIMVNAENHLMMGFSGSNSSQYVGAYYTGRASTDPSGQMAAPVRYRAGAAPQNNIDNYGRNRWGDYSLTTLDPVAQIEVWSLQSYAHSTNIWGTVFARLSLGGDCNNNGVSDYLDIQNGTSHDCNGNHVPDECDIPLGLSRDCNNNGIPDECDIASGLELDCNANGIPDVCDLLLGGSDCNNNGIPDSCDIQSGVELDCNQNSVPDACEIASGAAPDCNGNGIPDSCDIASGAAFDCNGNSIPDSCDLAAGTSVDCDGDGRPDECDVALGLAEDCNANLIPDSCEIESRPALAGKYYDTVNLSGTLHGRLDGPIDFNFGTGPAWPGQAVDNFSINWTGYLRTPAAAGSYTFYVYANDGVRLTIDGQTLLNQWSSQPLSERSASITLSANQVYSIVLDYFATSGPAQIHLSWQPPGQAKTIIPANRLMPGRDCNANGRNDLCDFSGSFTAQSPTFTPLGTGYPDTYVIPAAPDATGPVTFAFTALGDINTVNEYVTVSVNGTAVGRVFEVGSYLDCVEAQDSLTISAAQFNTLKAGGDAVILLTPTPQVSPTPPGCPDSNFIRFTTTYLRQLSADANGNLIPDECEQGPSVCAGDVNCDGVVDFADIDPFVEALGYAGGVGWPHSCPWLSADTNHDGNVDFADIDPFVARIGATCP